MGFGTTHAKISTPTSQITHPVEQPHLTNQSPLSLPYPAQTLPFVAASTAPDSAANRHADSTTSATNAIVQVTREPDVLPPLLHHSDLSPPNPLPSKVSTPVNVHNFYKALANYPNTELKTYLIDGLTNGFSIGFNDTAHAPTQPNNLLSATQHSKEVTKALQKEIQRGHTSGPFLHPPWKDLHCSPLGSREKKDGSRRLIMDLSQPQGNSINDNIEKEDFPCQYTHFDNATNMVYNKGKNCLMTKIDIKHAFRLLPVHPTQWILLGICCWACTSWTLDYLLDYDRHQPSLIDLQTLSAGYLTLYIILKTLFIIQMIFFL